MKTTKRTRAGFTLVELMVAAALCMFIMLIIGVAFQSGIDTFRRLRSVGQMQEKLRAASIVLKRDLAAEHFGGNFKTGFNGPYLRDQRLDLSGYVPPEQGYFEIIQANLGDWEGNDSDQVWSTRATTHRMRFTAKLSGKREEDWFYAYPDQGTPAFPAAVTNLGDPNFNRSGGVALRWGEIYYYLVANGQDANGQPLHTLYRSQRAILPLTTTMAAGNVRSADLSQRGAAAPIFNSPADVTLPANRVQATPYAGVRAGDDIVMTDVISFEIKANWTAGSLPSNTAQPRNQSQLVPYPGTGNGRANLDWPFDHLPNKAGWGMRFDTMSRTNNPNTNWDNPSASEADGFLNFNAGGSPNAPRNRVRVNSIQIRLRIWDNAAQQARQVTIVSDI